MGNLPPAFFNDVRDVLEARRHSELYTRTRTGVYAEFYAYPDRASISCFRDVFEALDPILSIAREMHGRRIKSYYILAAASVVEPGETHGHENTGVLHRDDGKKILATLGAANKLPMKVVDDSGVRLKVGSGDVVDLSRYRHKARNNKKSKKVNRTFVRVSSTRSRVPDIIWYD